ncbi:NAD(P)-dependent oxidoreductase [Cellulosimicrobium sp. NPDC057127]|uniref:NAD(P)-dependent oxidoreductase n=1 Tax=Cellulosimicrobium sp. NPDC057127 TaxID=3346026 RepID=UPI00362821B5
MGGRSATGLVGLGTMGEPVALRLLEAGTDLVVWNRTPGRADAVVRAGASRAADLDEVFARAATVVLVLTDEDAVDDVLGRGTPAFARRVARTTLVQVGTVAPDWSASLARDVRAAGGVLVEAPVSGSRGPAEDGELVVMLAGDDDAALARVERLVAPLARAVVRCGSVPAATRTKIAVNTYLVGMVTALVEAFHVAERTGVDPRVLERVLDAGPMASAVSRTKADKLVREDRSVQAAVDDAWRNARLAVAVARGAGAVTPVLAAAEEVYGATSAAGLGRADMVATLEALRVASRQAPGGRP